MAKTKEKEDKKDINIFESNFVPKHEVLNGDEKTALLEEINVSIKQLPKIKEIDPIVKILNAKKGDVLKITRNSLSAGEYIYYRVVV